MVQYRQLQSKNYTCILRQLHFILALLTSISGYFPYKFVQATLHIVAKSMSIINLVLIGFFRVYRIRFLIKPFDIFAVIDMFDVNSSCQKNLPYAYMLMLFHKVEKSSVFLHTFYRDTG